MTRLPDGVLKPAQRRLVDGDLVLSLNYRTVTIRPKRARDPRAAITLSWSVIYTRAISERADFEQRQKRRSRGARRKS